MSGYQGNPGGRTNPFGARVGMQGSGQRGMRPSSGELFGDLYGQQSDLIDQGSADARAYYERLLQMNRPLPQHSRLLFMRGY